MRRAGVVVMCLLLVFLAVHGGAGAQGVGPPDDPPTAETPDTGDDATVTVESPPATSVPTATTPPTPTLRPLPTPDPRVPPTPTPRVSAAALVQDVTFQSGSLTLTGRLFRPPGNGPWPAILWNHGSERYPGTYYADLAKPFVAAGYVFFGPFRRGQGPSPGPYIQDQLDAAPAEQRNQLQVQLLEEQVADQLAGLAYLKAQPFVDATRISVMGGSYGGVQTLLGAEANPGYRAAIDCSGAAQSWAANPLLQQRLVAAALKITIPLFLLQAVNDYDLTPSQVLADTLQRLGKPAQVRIYPPFGTGAVGQEGHNMCFTGQGPWIGDAIAFIESAK